MGFFTELLKDSTKFFVKSLFVALLVISSGLLLGTFLVDRTAKSQIDQQRTLVVQGSAKKKVQPDSVYVNVGQELNDSEASKVQTKATETINKLTTELEKIGVAKAQISTSNYQLFPNYDQNNKITGYRILLEVTVNLEKINLSENKVGEVIATAQKVGINQVRNLSFYLSNYDEVMESLEEEAIADAKGVAQSRAEQAGISLGKVLNISVGGYGFPTSPSYAPGLGAEGGRDNVDGGVKTPVLNTLPGEVEVETSVSLEYELR